MYRRHYFLQRKKNVELTKANRRLRRLLRSHEEFLFGPVIDGSL